MPLADVLKAGLGIDHEAFLIGVARRQAVAAVLQHENIAAQVLGKHFGNGQSVADVASIAVEHEDGDIAGALLVCADQEGAERLAVGGGDEQLLGIGDAKLGGAGHVGTRIGREASRVDDLAATVNGGRHTAGRRLTSA